MTERDLASYVRDVARTFGWKRFHNWISVKSEPGFPDEIFLRRDRLVVAELKSSTGKLTDAQVAWIEAWKQIPCAEVFIWRPADMDAIVEVLR